MPTSVSSREIRDDFDAIADLIPDGGQAGPHEDWLLENLSSTAGVALELGCGVGHLSRQLAGAFQRVEAVDFSERMIENARRSTPREMPVEYFCADLFAWLDEHPGCYDCVVTVATLHHVDLAAALRKIALAMKPGGRLLVLDLEDRSGWRHLFSNGAAWLAARYEFRATPRALRRAYLRHGRNETYLRLEDVAKIAEAELPGARVRSHLMWRYSILWDKPSSPASKIVR